MHFITPLDAQYTAVESTQCRRIELAVRKCNQATLFDALTLVTTDTIAAPDGAATTGSGDVPGSPLRAPPDVGRTRTSESRASSSRRVADRPSTGERDQSDQHGGDASESTVPHDVPLFVKL